MIKDDDRIADVVTETLSDIDSILFAYLFGSRTTGKSGPMSDVDVAVYLRQGVDLTEEKLTIIQGLTTSLQSDDLDVVLLNVAPTALVGRILNCRKVLIDRDPFRRHSFESLELRKYMDFSIKETANLNHRFGLGR